MRILFFLAIIALFFSCNNNLDSVGQDIMGNDNYVDRKEYYINEIATVKLDSFIASSGYTEEYKDAALKELIMGKYHDDFSGTTLAIPCFPIVPTSQPALVENLTLDSVTLNFTFGGKIWGDTIHPNLQKYYLYRLDELPELNKDDEYLLYNTYPLPPHTEILSVMEFYPLKDNIRKSYFKLDTEKGLEWGDKLFEAMMYNGKIYNDLPWSFLNEFKGLAIVPDDNNDCLLNIRATADSLYLRFHYHKSTEEVTYDFPLGEREFMYNSIETQNASLFQGLTSQKESVTLQEAGISLVQGLAGYMTKITLPRLPIPEQYTTIIKAELELTPEIFLNPSIAMPPTIYTFSSNDKNEVLSVLYNNTSSGTRVTGTFVPDLISNSKSKYIFDLTDYYQRLLSSSQDNLTDRQILLRIPDWTTSFNRAVITEIPKLRVYYAYYNR